MEKILPINMNTNITTECWTFQKLAAILSDTKYIPWYLEKFINLTIVEDFRTMYYPQDTPEHYSIFDEVIEFRYFSTKDHIVSQVIEAIDENGYVLIDTDYYYMPHTAEYQKSHYTHLIIVYGYDKSSQAFYIVDLDKSYSWKKFKCPFSQIEEAFYSRCDLLVVNKSKDYKLMPIYHLPASSFYLKDSFNLKQPRINRIFHEISNCLSGLESRSIEPKLWNNITNVRRSGISIYKGFYEDLYNMVTKDPTYLKNNFIPILGLKSLTECKTGLKIRLEYLVENNIIKSFDSVISSIDEICNLLVKCQSLVTNYSLTDNISCFERTMELLRQCEEIDTKLLKEAADILFDNISGKLDDFLHI